MSDHQLELDDRGNPILDQLSEEGFVDFTFRIVPVSSNATAHRLRLVASHEGRVVGLDAIVRRGMRGGLDADMNVIQTHVYRAAVRFVRTGEESDALLGILAELYGLPPRRRRMVDVLPMTGILLHEDEVDLEYEAVRIKLFGCDSDEQIEREQYFESFFNLDLDAGFVFWNEKDPDYRRPLVQGLSVPAPGAVD